MSLRSITISWPVSEDEAFRAAYLAETGEAIQAFSALSEDGLIYSVSSWRVTDEQLQTLSVQFPNMETQ